MTPRPPPLVGRPRPLVRRFLETRLAQPTRGLAIALLLGDRSALDADLRQRFARSGTAHLLAISGLHVGLMALVVGGLARAGTARSGPLRLRVSPRAAGIVAGLAAAMAYGSLTGWAVSTRRAALMAAALAVILLSRRRADAVNLCAAAWCAVLLADPAQVTSAATGLSFCSVLAIVRLVPSPSGTPLRTLIATSAAAVLGTAPLTLSLSGQLPLLAVPANVIAVPVLGGLLVPLLFAAAGLGTAWPAGGTALLAAADAVARAGCSVVGILGDPGWSPVLEARPPPGLVAASLAVLAAGLALPRTRWRWIGAAASLAVALLPVHPGAPPRGQLVLTVLDVGHGDALLVSLPDGSHALVDAGAGGGPRDEGDRVVRPALRRLGVRRLSVLAVTHTHADHIGGAAAVLRAVPADELWLPLPPVAGGPEAEVAAVAARRGTAVRILSRSPPPARTLGGAELAVLHPRPGHPCPEPGASCPPNDHSLVMRLRHGRTSLLLTGDAEANLESALLRRHAPLRSQVLKVPHHGSDTSTTAALLSAVAPAVAVASLDPENRHAFPRPSVLRRVRHAGARWLDTGRDGTVQIALDGEAIRLRTYRLDRGLRRWSRWQVIWPRGEPGSARPRPPPAPSAPR